MSVLAQTVFVREFTLWEIMVIAIVLGLGIAFFTWLLAGYYERRGGLGKK